MTALLAEARDEIAMAPEPVAGPACWKGPDLKPGEWVYRLGASEIAELEAAVQDLLRRGDDLVALTRDDFPLPRLGETLLEMRRDILDGRGFAVLRGLPVERYSLREMAVAFWGIGTYLGYPVMQNARGHVLGHVIDLGGSGKDRQPLREVGLPLEGVQKRLYSGSGELLYHTDSTDMVGLLCRHPAKSGGVSYLASIQAIHNRILTERPDLLKVLYEPFYVDRLSELPPGAKPYYRMPVFHWHRGKLTAMYMRQAMWTCERLPGVPKLTDEQREALRFVDSLAEDPAMHLSMSFEAGDMQWINNHLVMHSRSEYVDHPEPERRRHLLRLWLVTPDREPLPQWYYDRYRGGRRGGHFLPGVSEVAPIEPVLGN